MTEPYRLTATEALALLKNGTLTVEDYAKSLLARISERDSAVRAWAYLNPNLILSEARKLDQIPAEKRGPLHGIAIGVKDVILTKGLFASSLLFSFPLFCSSPHTHSLSLFRYDSESFKNWICWFGVELVLIWM